MYLNAIICHIFTAKSQYFVILGPHTLIIKYTCSDNDNNDDVDDDDDDDNNDDDNNYNDNDDNYNDNNNDTDTDNNDNNDKNGSQTLCQSLIRICVFKIKLLDIIDIVGILMATMSCQFCMKCSFLISFTYAAICVLNADVSLRILSTDTSECFFISETLPAVAEIGFVVEFFQNLS